VAEQAEAYLQEQARNQEQRGGSLSAQNYDEVGSRSEWAEQWSD
jgi:hypothetical protein